MARSKRSCRCYCLLAEEATPESAHSLQCGVGGHSHLSFAELYGAIDYVQGSRDVQRLGAKYVGSGGLLERGEVEWLYFPRVLRLRREPEKRKQDRVQVRDLSARVGAFLASEARKRKKPQPWAQVMLENIRERRRR